jgi:hypothetical protein
VEVKLPSLKSLLADELTAEARLADYNDYLLNERRKYNTDGWPSNSAFKAWGKRWLALHKRHHEFLCVVMGCGDKA